MRVRNLKLLVQDVFKQFDLLFKEIDIQEQLEAHREAQRGSKEAQDIGSQIGINLGEL